MMATKVATGQASRKVVAATGGAAVGSAFAVVGFWLIEGTLNRMGLEVPEAVRDALITIITALTTFAAGYYMPPGAAETVMQGPDGSLRSALAVPSPG